MTKAELQKHVTGLSDSQIHEILNYLHWKLEELFHDSSSTYGPSIDELQQISETDILTKRDCRDILNNIKIEIENL